MTRLNEADVVNKTRPLFTLSLEMTRLVNETRLLLVPGVNSDIYGMFVSFHAVSTVTPCNADDISHLQYASKYIGIYLLPCSIIILLDGPVQIAQLLPL